MLRARALAAMAMLATACAGSDLAPSPEYLRIPRELRLGAADMAIEAVEQNVSRAELLAALQAQMTHETICFRWPGLWLDPVQMRSAFVVRYDLMARDWGAEAAAISGARMQEFVEYGFLTARDRPEKGPSVIEYTLTREGQAYLRGSPYGGEHPTFCAPAERRVVEVQNTEFGRFDCGSVRVRFTHVGDGWPSWARTEAARARVAQTWAPIGETTIGSVSMSRQWFRPRETPPGVTNGQMRSLCLDPSSGEVAGEDMELRAAQ